MAPEPWPHADHDAALRADPCRGEDRVDDRGVAGAAAEVAADRLDHLLARGVGVAVEQRLGGEQHAGRAVAALGGEVLHERLLQRVQAGAFGKAGDSGDLGALHRLGQRNAGELRPAVDQHGAGAAGALAAAIFRGHVAEPAPEHV